MDNSNKIFWCTCMISNMYVSNLDYWMVQILFWDWKLKILRNWFPFTSSYIQTTLCSLAYILILIHWWASEMTKDQNAISLAKLYMPTILAKSLMQYHATLDEGSRTREQWIQAILLVKSFKLVPRPLKQGFKTKKWQIEARRTWHLFWRENQLVQTKTQC